MRERNIKTEVTFCDSPKTNAIPRLLSASRRTRFVGMTFAFGFWVISDFRHQRYTNSSLRKTQVVRHSDKENGLYDHERRGIALINEKYFTK